MFLIIIRRKKKSLEGDDEQYSDVIDEDEGQINTHTTAEIFLFDKISTNEKP